MADPTIGLTFSDYVIRVAEYLGVAYYGSNGQGAAQVPVDAHDLDLCKRIVNDGYRRFMGESPLWRFLTVPVSVQFQQTFTGTVTTVGNVLTTFSDSSKVGNADGSFVGYQVYVTHNTTIGGVGTQGNILGIDIYNVTAFVGSTGTFTVTRQTRGGGVSSLQNLALGDGYEMAINPPCVDGQNFRYFLPDDFAGTFAGPWTYDVGGPRISINGVDEHRIRELRVGANTSGTPSVYATRAINTDDTATGQRWEVMFWPRPTGLNRVTAVYRRFPQAFVNLTDRSVASFQHDDTVLACALAAAELQRMDTVGSREQMYQSALKRSRAYDNRAAAEKVSDFGDRSEDRAVGGRRPLNYYSVSTYNGSNIGDLT